MKPTQRRRRSTTKTATRKPRRATERLSSLPVTVSLAQLAKIAGKGENTLSALVSAGLPVKAAKRSGSAASVDLAEGVQWLIRRDREQLEAKIAELVDAPDEKLARARWQHARAEWQELQVSKARGEVVAADAVESIWKALASSVREGVLSISGLAVQEGLISAESEPALDAICRDAIVSLSERGMAELATDSVEAADGGEDEQDEPKSDDQDA